eukprot:GEMP01073755.1.p1 GENE.GEMP01073755.1~~GEMP01073755.1.p1  ORF type:complete len:153 (-),score=30.36 GEMP01073755.1:572-1030(-)
MDFTPAYSSGEGPKVYDEEPITQDTFSSDTAEEVYLSLRTIRDPEFPHTLVQLRVIVPEGISVDETGRTISVTLVPTVAHCSLASLIGLCVRKKLQIEFNDDWKVDVYIRPDTHADAAEITKQINDKERVAAAMENPELMKLLERCIEDSEW